MPELQSETIEIHVKDNIVDLQKALRCSVDFCCCYERFSWRIGFKFDSTLGLKSWLNFASHFPHTCSSDKLTSYEVEWTIIFTWDMPNKQKLNPSQPNHWLCATRSEDILLWFPIEIKTWYVKICSYFRFMRWNYCNN